MRRVEGELTKDLKRVKHYDPAERFPIDGVVPREWRNAVLDDSGRVQRVAYELCVLRSLRDALRRCEIYVSGATRWRNPEDDLPGGCSCRGRR